LEAKGRTIRSVEEPVFPRVAFVGAGHVTRLLLSNLLGRKGTLPPNRVVVSGPRPLRLREFEERFGTAVTTDNVEAARSADVVFVNVRPHQVKEVLRDLASVDWADRLLVSLAAGVPLERYRVLGESCAVARILPNPPSAIGRGVVAVSFDRRVPPERREGLLSLLRPLGTLMPLPESQMDLVTSLTSPAPVLAFAQALVDGAVLCGMERGDALAAVRETLAGTLEMWSSSGKSLESLLVESSTPGGVSVESLFTLERRGVRGAVMEAVREGTLKAERLGRGGW
jgi:pyrroline-5-carboxylate reductase